MLGLFSRVEVVWIHIENRLDVGWDLRGSSCRYVFSNVLSNSFSRVIQTLPCQTMAIWISICRISRGTQYRALWSSAAEGPFADRPPAGELRRIALVTWSTVVHCFAKWIFDSLVLELLLAATIDRSVGRHRVCENRPNIRLPRDYRFAKGWFRYGVSLFVQVEKRKDSSSLLWAPAGIWVQVDGYSCRPCDPPVIIFVNDEGVILEVKFIIHGATHLETIGE